MNHASRDENPGQSISTTTGQLLLNFIESGQCAHQSLVSLYKLTDTKQNFYCVEYCSTAGSAARQAIAEAEATLPKGMTRGDFGRLAGFEQGLAASSRASTEATAEIISRLKSAGITSRSIAAFQKIYEGEVSRNPSNLSAIHRAALLANILRRFQ